MTKLKEGTNDASKALDNLKSVNDAINKQNEFAIKLAQEKGNGSIDNIEKEINIIN